MSEYRCEMRGKLAADGWRHTTRGGIDKRWRCPNKAVFKSSDGTRFCAACKKHLLDYNRATIRLAEQQLQAVLTAKRAL